MGYGLIMASPPFCSPNAPTGRSPTENMGEESPRSGGEEDTKHVEEDIRTDSIARSRAVNKETSSTKPRSPSLPVGSPYEKEEVVVAEVGRETAQDDPAAACNDDGDEEEEGGGGGRYEWWFA